MANASLAANAYSAVAGLVNKGGEGQSAAGTTGLSSAGFDNLVKSAIAEVREGGQATEAQALNLVEGRANVVDVVTAVAETEVAMETVVSVRDKVISAYEEIMRMPI
ncbi:flagellar hook-basal body complex protein FliE [Polycladidibacter hongkongensis]|uniref:flagellar hook-basal body complex protein FliE n=1 Tax=Polycladidibacter hongkongensis TaxID=1647556 RepID=UPI00083573D4|nr:flagellar hook-basal body complex protein FliE [Pseudovibrio hongkongensis]